MFVEQILHAVANKPDALSEVLNKLFWYTLHSWQAWMLCKVLSNYDFACCTKSLIKLHVDLIKVMIGLFSITYKVAYAELLIDLIGILVKDPYKFYFYTIHSCWLN